MDHTTNANFPCPPPQGGNNGDDVPENLGSDNVMNDPAYDEVLFLGNGYADGDINYDQLISGLTADQTMQGSAPQLMPPVVPVPSSVSPLTYLPTPPPLPQDMAPNMAMGPSWNPMIGWYYPAVSAAPPPQMIAPAPRPALATRTASPTSTPTPTTRSKGNRVAKTPARAKSTRKGKLPKYGPAAYLEQQAKIAAGEDLSNDEMNFTSAAKERADREQARVNPKKRIGAPHKRNQPSIVQVCVCAPEKEMAKIKRPKNAFIIYRSAYSGRIFNEIEEKNNPNVSRAASAMWNAEPKEVQARYYEMAKQEAAKHKEMYPDYKYQPGLAQKLKFGSASCTCGAYKLNLAANGIAPDADSNTGVSDFDNLFTTTGNHFAAPQVVMPGFEYQQTGNAAPATFPDPDGPIATRTRSASPPKSNTYVDPALDDLFQQPSTVVDASQTRHRPSSLAFASFSDPNLIATQDPIPDFDFNSPPAHNTRSRSRTSAELQEQLQLDGAFADGQEMDWSLFDGHWDDNGQFVLNERRTSTERQRSIERSLRRKTPSPKTRDQ